MDAKHVGFHLVLSALEKRIPADYVATLNKIKKQSLLLDENDARQVLYVSYLYAIANETESSKINCERFIENYWNIVLSDTELLNIICEIAFHIRDFSAIKNFVILAYKIKTNIIVAFNKPYPNIPGIVLWSLQKINEMTFTFNESIYSHPFKDVLLKHWVQCMPMYCAFRRAYPEKTGDLAVNLEDFGSTRGLAFCDFRSEFSLITDPIFLQTIVYARAKRAYGLSPVAWERRKPMAIWRGTTTGFFDCDGQKIKNWQDLPRIQLCLHSKKNRDVLDAGITGIVQLNSTYIEPILKELGILCAHMDSINFQNYKFQIDIDGNSNSWPGLFTKLCTGSVVLKITSPRGFRQWYYNRLIPWYNFVPIKKDLSDLFKIIDWLNQHDSIARSIGNNGKSLAESMVYEKEITSSVSFIAKAFDLEMTQE